MPNYEIGVTTAAAGSAAPEVQFIAAASRRDFLREQGFFTTQATATSIGMNTPAAAGAPYSAVTPLPLDTNDAAAVATVAISWTSAPTAPTNVYFRKCTLGAAVGAGVIWKKALDEPWVLAKSGNWIWWNYGGSSIAITDLYFEFVE
jgi:hypothetical protein